MKIGTQINHELIARAVDLSAALHSHVCPRQVLGVRIGLLGLQLLELQAPYAAELYANPGKRLLTIVETDGCGADGVSAATNCWVGRRTLRVEDYGIVAATLCDRETGRCVRITPHPESRDRAQQFAPPDVASRWHAYLAAYRIMPDEQLLTATEVTLNQSLEQIVSLPGKRAICDECGVEIMNERELIVAGRTLCHHCAGQGYLA